MKLLYINYNNLLLPIIYLYLFSHRIVKNMNNLFFHHNLKMTGPYIKHCAQCKIITEIYSVTQKLYTKCKLLLLCHTDIIYFIIFMI